MVSCRVLRPRPQQHQSSLLPEASGCRPSTQLWGCPSCCAHLSNPGDPTPQQFRKTLDMALLFSNLLL